MTVIQLDPRDRDLLIRTVWDEARGEPLEGQYAVIWVIINRAREKKMSVGDVCVKPWQFSGWNAGDRPGLDPHDPLLFKVPYGDYEKFLKIVDEVVCGGVVDPTEGCTHYHADYIKPPKWADPTKMVKKIGRHIFYRGIAY